MQPVVACEHPKYIGNTSDRTV